MMLVMLLTHPLCPVGRAETSLLNQYKFRTRECSYSAALSVSHSKTLKLTSTFSSQQSDKYLTQPTCSSPYHPSPR